MRKHGVSLFNLEGTLSRRNSEATLKDKIKAQRSGFDFERRSSGVTELSSMLGSEGYEACDDDGGIAQLGERLPCKQEVSGSIPLVSTTGANSSAG